jgi:hypothetical protein
MCFPVWKLKSGEILTFFENEVMWIDCYGMLNTEYQQWYADRMHMYAAKGHP